MNDKEKSPGAGDAPAGPLFRAVFDQSKDGIFIETPEGEILDANRAVTELLGYSREELLKMRVSDLVPPEVAAELSPTIRPESVAPGAYVETVEVARDGTQIPVEVSNSLVEIEGEKRVIAVIRDISERKQASEALRRSEEKYRGIFEESVAAIYLFDAEKNFIDSNQAGIDLLGYTRGELLRMSIPDVDADPEAVLPAHRELLSGGRLVNYEHRLRRKDGEVITVLNNSRPLTDAEGKVVGMLSTLLDITERKRVEEELGKSEELYRALVENVKEGIVVVRGEKLIYANPGTVKMLGYDADHLYRIPFVELVHPEDREAALTNYRKIIQGEEAPSSLTIRAVTGDGGVKWVELSGVPVEWEGEPALLSFVSDVTARKRAEEALRNREEFQRLLMKLASDFINLPAGDLDGGLERMLRMLGEFTRVDRAYIFKLDDERREAVNTHEWCAPGIAPQKENLQASPYDFFPDMLRTLREGKIYSPPSVSDLPADRSERRILEAQDIQSLILLPLIEEEKCIGFIGFDTVAEKRTFSEAETSLLEVAAEIISNVLARSRSQRALRESEERFARAFKTAPYAIAVTRPETGEFVEVNDAFTTVTGYTREEAMASSSVGLNIWESPEDRASVVRDLREGREVLGREYRFRKKDGTLIYGLFSAQPLILGGESLLISSVNDITPRRQAEREKERLGAELARARKLEALGRLAGGVTHDFNNMLTAILGTAELALRQVSPKSLLRSDLEEIRGAGERAAALTRRLMAFASKQEATPRVLDLNLAVEGTLKMLRRLIGEDIELDWRPAPELWKVRVDESQVDQVLINLCVNARDVLPSGGRLTIETANVSRPEEPAPGDYVRLTVGDDGEGMDEETLEHLFEPFYTTKEPGRGAGLGMATVYGIVTQNRGLIEVESEPGRGTRVIVHLPRYTGELEVEPEIEEEAREHRGGETVLLVEDEKSILTVLERELADRGYTVLAFSDPLQALRQAGEYPGEIHLLVTDTVMPGMNGRELAARFAALRPAAGRLLVSGHSEVIAAAGDLEPGLHFLPKPLTGSLLAARVRQILDGKKGSVIEY